MGKICCICGIPLPPPEAGRERRCDKCKSPRRRIYMCFSLRGAWCVQFLEADLKTPLPRQLTFRDSAKIREMFDRFSDRKMLEDRNALDNAIESGRGGIYLNLTAEQYSELKKGGSDERTIHSNRNPNSARRR